jgi:VWFA-related protein
MSNAGPRMSTLAVMLLGTVLAFVSAALAQEHSPDVFRSGVDVVRFDVRVTDGSGHAITDLKPGEIQIVEDGRPRPVLLFQHVQEPAGAYSEAALRAVSAEVSTNQGMPRGHLYILVFDQHHITTGNEQIARRAAEAFITRRLRPSDRVAVFGLPGPGPQLGFTADPTRAVAELQKVRGALDRNMTTALGRLSQQEAYEIASGNDRVTVNVLSRISTEGSSDVAPLATLGRAQSNEDAAVTRRLVVENARTFVAAADSETRQSLQRVSDLIEQYRAIEGRKTVVFFSEGFHQQNVTRELEQVAAAAAQSYAVFYAFDLNRRGNNTQDPEPGVTSEASEIQARLEPLGSLATETDGALVTDAASHLDAALDRIADQSQDYYLVGFTPSEAALANRGHYRRVTVRVTRPGARVSARTGYAAPPSAPLDRRRAIDAALSAPFVQQALRVEYTTYALRSEATGRARVVLALEAELPVKDDRNLTADIVFVVRDVRDGHAAASGTDTIPLPKAPASGSSTGIGAYRVQFELPPGSYLMRAVVREPGGLVGSADRRIDIRAFSGPDVAVSDLVLGSEAGALPVRASAFTEDGLSGIVETYGRAPEQLRSLSVTATLLPAGGNEPAAKVDAVLADAQPAGGGVTRRASFAIPLTDISPGSYVAHVRVSAGSEPVADLTREVDVRAGAAPHVSLSATTAFRPENVLEGDYVRRAQVAFRAANTPAAGHAVKGLDLFGRGDYAGAATELSEALRLDQSSAAAAFVLGWAYEGAGDHRQAIGAWRAAATIDPKLVPAHLAVADGYLRISEPALAAQALRAGLAALPDSLELQAKLAEINEKNR